jgi:hypothetical protein
MAIPATATREPWDYQALRVFIVGASLVITGLLGGYVVGQAAMDFQSAVLLIPAVPLMIIATWKRPLLAPLLALCCALLFEQNPYEIGTHDGPFTAYVAAFRSSGMILLPVEILLLLGVLLWLMRGGLTRSLNLPRSPIAKALMVFWLLLLLGFAIGLSKGGQFNIALWEVRPFLLLSVTYLLTSSLVKSASGIRAVMWIFVLCVGFKGAQGTYMFFSFARAMNPRPESLLSHEESVFFGVFMVLTVGLWVYGQRGALRIAATALFPLVLIANLANSRRTAWPVVMLGLCVMLIIAWVTRPTKRRVVGPVLVVLGMVSMVYFPLYWNKTGGTLAQPARAVRSTVSPDPRDESSDLYRQQENANLTLNIQQSGKLGTGFGLPINYALPIVDVSNFDPMIKYIPHNGVLWIWMRLGVQGEIVFWIFLGVSIIAACRVARSLDDGVALLGGVAVAGLIGYMIQGYEDLGFATVRIAIVIGALLGCVEAASRFGGRVSTQQEAIEEPVPA